MPPTPTALLRRLRARVDATPGRREQGFVLLEELVAISLLVIVMAALATFFLTVVQSTTYERAKQSAVQLANTQMDTIRSIPPATLTAGLPNAATNSQYAAAQAIPAIAPYLATAAMTQATGPGTTQTVASQLTRTANNITYTVSNYLGTCSVLNTTPGASNACTTAAAQTTGSVPYLRAVVAVTWPGSRCPVVAGAGLCTYVTSSLVSMKPDPQFVLADLAPAVPLVANPGPQVTTVGAAVSLQLALEPTTGVPTTTWAVTTGTLPAGLVMTPAGLISGTATTASTATLTVTATDAFLRQATAPFTWTVVPPPTITGLTTPFTSTAGATITPQPLTYTCPTALAAYPGIGANCTETLTGAPSGIGIATTKAGPFLPSVTVADTGGSGPLYLGGVVDSTTTGGTTTNNTYAGDVVAQGASNYWKLDDTTAGTAVDSIPGSQNNPMIEQAGVTQNAPGGSLGSSDLSATFSGTAKGWAAEQLQIAAPSTFSESIWFKTTSTSGGKLMGFGDSNGGPSLANDRQVYMDNTGVLRFGNWQSNAGASHVVTSAASYNDGVWHQAVGQMSPAGLSLYVDGSLVATDSTAISPYASNGYWRIGGDSLTNAWPGTFSSTYFAGSLDDASIYPTVLTSAQIQQQYSDSGRTVVFSPVLTPTAGATVTGTAVTGTANKSSWTVNPPPTVTGLTTPFATTATATITNQTLPYTCPTGSCTFALAGAPAGIGLSTSPTGAGPYAATATLSSGPPSGNLYLRGTVDPAAATSAAYANDVTSQGATNYWRLGDGTGTTGKDATGGSDLTEGAGVSHGTPGAILTATDRASTFDGSTAGGASTTTSVLAPQVFSESIWFKTTTANGGKLIGFGNVSSGYSSSYDRHIYMDSAGHLTFGVHPPGAFATETTTATYNDGQWHQAVGTLSGAGMSFYIDGSLFRTDPTVTTAQAGLNGFWRLGGDQINGWPAVPSVGANDYFAGALDEAAIYPGALTAVQVQQQYADAIAASYTVTVTPTDTTTTVSGVPTRAAWTVDPVPTVTGMTNPFTTTAGATIATQVLPYTCPSGSCIEALTGAPPGIGLNAADTGSPQPSVATIATTSGNIFLRGTVPGSAGTSGAYAADVVGQGASSYWHLDELSGTTGADSKGSSPLTESLGVGHGAAGSLATAPGTAATFDGSALGTARSQNLISAPTTFSESIWFKTTTRLGGQRIGFVDSSTDLRSAAHDRQVYMDTGGHVIFGVSPVGGVTSVAVSSGTYNDGSWHQAVATMQSGAGGGQALYVDGRLVGSQAITTTAAYNGYWRLGGDDLSAWPAGPSSNFTGTLDEASVYLTTALSAKQVAQQYADAYAVSYSLAITPTDTPTTVNGPLNSASWSVNPAPTVSGLTNPFATNAGATITAQPLSYSCPTAACTYSVTAPAGIGLALTSTGTPATTVAVGRTSGTLYLVGTTSTSAAGATTVTVVGTDTTTGVIGAPATAAWTIRPVPSITGLMTPFATTAGATIATQALTYTCPSGNCTYTLAGAPSALLLGVGLSLTTGGVSVGLPSVTVGGTSGTIYLIGNVAGSPTTGTYTVTVTPKDNASGVLGAPATAVWTVGPPTVSGLTNPFATTAGATIAAQALAYTCPTTTCTYTLAGAPTGIGLSTNNTATSGGPTITVGTASGTIYLIGTSSTNTASKNYTVTVTPYDSNSRTNGPANTATWTVGPPTVTGLTNPFATTAGATITAQQLTYTCPSTSCTYTVAGAPTGIGLALSSGGSANSSVTVADGGGSIYLVGASSPNTRSTTFTVTVTPKDTTSGTTGTANSATWTVGPPTVTGVSALSTTAGATITPQKLGFTCPTAVCTATVTGAPPGIGVSLTTGATSGGSAVTLPGTAGSLYLVGTSSAGSGSSTAYASDVSAQAANYWHLNETGTGSVGTDAKGSNNFVENAVGHGATGAVPTNSDTASTFNGSTSYAATQSSFFAPTTFSESLWFRTTTTSGGVLFGFGTSNSAANSGNYDRRTWMDNAGHLSFGVYAGGVQAITTTGTYNDGAWHHAVGTVAGTAMSFYVDGALVSSRTNGTNAEITNPGYWRVGEDNTAGWAPTSTSAYFQGSLAQVAVYPTALALSDVQQQYADAFSAPYSVGVTPTDTNSGTAGTASQATWRVFPAPTVGGLTTPFTATAGARITNQTLSYSCPSASCTFAVGGGVGGIGLSASSTATSGTSSLAVTATSGLMYLAGTPTTAGSYTVTVTPTDTNTGTAGPSNQAAWTVRGAPTIGNLPVGFSLTVGEFVPNQSLAYTCPSSNCTFTIVGAPAGIGISADTTSTPGTSASVSASSGTVYVRGTISGSAAPGTYTVYVTPIDNASGVSGTASQASYILYAPPTVSGLTNPLKTSVGATIANDDLTYTCPAGNCTFTVNNAPNGIGLAPDTGTAPTGSVTVTATSGTIYLRGTINASTPTGNSTVTVTSVDNTATVTGGNATSAWTLVAPMSIGSPGAWTVARGTAISKTFTYTCQTSQCTVSVAGAPGGIGLDTNGGGALSSSLTVNAGSGSLLLRGTPGILDATGGYPITLTLTDPAGSTVSVSFTWNVT